MGNRLHDTSVDPEPIIADLRPGLLSWMKQ